MKAWCMMACGYASMHYCILRITYVIDCWGYVCLKYSAGLELSQFRDNLSHSTIDEFPMI